MSREEFRLSGGVSVASVYTMSPKLGKNFLGTFFEATSIQSTVSSYMIQEDAKQMLIVGESGKSYKLVRTCSNGHYYRPVLPLPTQG